MHNYLKSKEYYCKKNSGGWSKVLSLHDHRKFSRLVCTLRYSFGKFIQRAWLYICQKMMYNMIRRPERYIYAEKLSNA